MVDIDRWMMWIGYGVSATGAAASVTCIIAVCCDYMFRTLRDMHTWARVFYIVGVIVRRDRIRAARAQDASHE